MFEAFDLLKTGGPWLGRVHSWIQNHKHNGSTVMWGSGDVLSPPVTVREIEEVAAIAAAEITKDSLSGMLSRLRTAGWMVAVHNDYRQNGEMYTFWLFTHADGTYLKGEGRTDEDAVRKVLGTILEKALQSRGNHASS